MRSGSWLGTWKQTLRKATAPKLEGQAMDITHVIWRKSKKYLSSAKAGIPSLIP